MAETGELWVGEANPASGVSSNLYSREGMEIAGEQTPFLAESP